MRACDESESESESKSESEFVHQTNHYFQTGLTADASDAMAVRTVLALKGLDPPVRGHVVIELMDVDNRSIVELIGDPLVETVVSHDIIGRLMVCE